MIVRNLCIGIQMKDKVHECYNCLKLMIQAYLHVGFLKIFI